MNPEIVNELKRIKEKEQKADKERNMLCNGYKITNDFTKFRNIHAFGNAIKNGYKNYSVHGKL